MIKARFQYLCRGIPCVKAKAHVIMPMHALAHADKKRLATSYANLARSRTVADGTCT